MAQLAKLAIPAGIRRRSRAVAATVHLDDEPNGRHQEVGDEIAEHDPPPRLDAELLGPELLPRPSGVTALHWTLRAGARGPGGRASARRDHRCGAAGRRGLGERQIPWLAGVGILVARRPGASGVAAEDVASLVEDGADARVVLGVPPELVVDVNPAVVLWKEAATIALQGGSWQVRSRTAI